MTFIPENGALCDCWVLAPRWVREAEKFERPHNTFSPRGLRGLRSCPDCRGAGYFMHWPRRAA